MSLSRCALPLIASCPRILPSLVPSMSSLCARYSTSASSCAANSSHRRNLQTVTAYHPPHLLESGVPPPRNADAPPSSLTGNTKIPMPTATSLSPAAAAAANEATLLSASNTTTNTPASPSFRSSRLRSPRKAAMTLTPSAISQLRRLLSSPDPKLIRVGVKNRGCSGLAYNLEYVDKPGNFDEEVVQDGVKVLIDSKALLSIIGSEMDWVEDKLSARFIFKNPNIKEQCGCGESFSVGR